MTDSTTISSPRTMCTEPRCLHFRAWHEDDVDDVIHTALELTGPSWEVSVDSSADVPQWTASVTIEYQQTAEFEYGDFVEFVQAVHAAETTQQLLREVTAGDPPNERARYAAEHPVHALLSEGVDGLDYVARCVCGESVQGPDATAVRGAAVAHGIRDVDFEVANRRRMGAAREGSVR